MDLPVTIENRLSPPFRHAEKLFIARDDGVEGLWRERHVC